MELTYIVNLSQDIVQAYLREKHECVQVTRIFGDHSNNLYREDLYIQYNMPLKYPHYKSNNNKVD